MDTSWLELLNNIDKMVLGSIVGSIVLAFVLLVAIFSYKIKGQQDGLTLLSQELSAVERTIGDLTAQRDDLERKVADGVTIVEHYQALETDRQKAFAALQKERDEAQAQIETLREKVVLLEKEKASARHQEKQTHAELLAAREEIEAVLKRNEFWVEQLSELRTKHDALKLKLRSLGKGRS